MLSELTVGWLILAAALLTFVGGSGAALLRRRGPTSESAGRVRKFRESGGRRRALRARRLATRCDDEELDQTILMPTIVLGCGFLLTAIFLLGYEIAHLGVLGAACSTASRIGPRQTGPWPGSSTSVSSMPSADRLRTQAA